MLVARCRPLADRFNEVPVIPQPFKSLRENVIQATYNIGVVMEQMLQADK
jgi:hypothetical protein